LLTSKNLDKSKFRSKLFALLAFTSPVDDVDAFANQLDHSLTDVLDKPAPLLTQTFESLAISIRHPCKTNSGCLE